MQGTITDTACTIAVSSWDQTIDMEIIPLADIVRDGQGRKKAFSIELINCEISRSDSRLPDWKHFQVIFDGEAEGRLFGVRGDASGVALQITDNAGNIAAPGEPLSLEDVIPGNRQLSYSMRLVANNHVLKAGNYFSLIRFKLDYF